MTRNNTFNTQQLLSGEQLLLRPLAESDFDELYGVASDPLLWEQHPQQDRYTKEVFSQFFKDAINSNSAYVIIDKSLDNVIGSSRFHNPNYSNSSIEIGWTFLDRSYWGGQYNAELKDLMLNYALLYFRNIHFCIGETNFRSLGAVKKIGAKLSQFQDDNRPGHIFYVVTNETYVGLSNYGNQ